jgi:hypothetical protein
VSDRSLKYCGRAKSGQIGVQWPIVNDRITKAPTVL